MQICEEKFIGSVEEEASGVAGSTGVPTVVQKVGNSRPGIEIKKRDEIKSSCNY